MCFTWTFTKIGLFLFEVREGGLGSSCEDFNILRFGKDGESIRR